VQLEAAGYAISEGTARMLTVTCAVRANWLEEV
jgi:hypothetical protein